MPSCATCEAYIISGKSLGSLRSCSEGCYRYALHPGYCTHCQQETSEEDAGSTFTINLVGTRLLGFGEHCPHCYSQSQRRWVCLVLPTVPLGPAYRVLRLGERYFSRKVVSPLGKPRTPISPQALLELIEICADEARERALESHRCQFENGQVPLFLGDLPRALELGATPRLRAGLDEWFFHLGLIGAATCCWGESLPLPVEGVSPELLVRIAALQSFRLAGLHQPLSPQRLFVRAALLACRTPAEVITHGLWATFAPHHGIPKDRDALSDGVAFAEHCYRERSRLLEKLHNANSLAH